jgi:hypothetical protein
MVRKEPQQPAKVAVVKKKAPVAATAAAPKAKSQLQLALEKLEKQDNE